MQSAIVDALRLLYRSRIFVFFRHNIQSLRPLCGYEFIFQLFFSYTTKIKKLFFSEFFCNYNFLGAVLNMLNTHRT